MKLIHLHHLPGMSRKLLRLFLQKPGLLKALYDLSPSNFQTELMLTPDFTIRLYNHLHNSPILPVADAYLKHGIHIITILDDLFPEQLRHIPDPPLIMYYQGNLQLSNPSEKLLSVVGSRSVSPLTYKVMDYLLKPLISKKFTLVSGLAYGVDGYAHQLALNSSTIAVLGSGLLHPYPSRNKSLFDIISNHHLVISEYPPTFQPKKWYFPERNRIISGLSPATLVIQAKAKSGSLITADQALEQGREVYAVPGSVLDDSYAGTNFLIQQGAKPILTAEDVINEY